MFVSIYVLSVECVEGGKNVLLDSFSLLEQLRMESPQHFATLARVPATFQNTAYSQRYVNLDRDDDNRLYTITLWCSSFNCTGEERRHRSQILGTSVLTSLWIAVEEWVICQYISIPIVQSYNRESIVNSSTLVKCVSKNANSKNGWHFFQFWHIK